jgi:deferrochelatase/peroxidase EfeB
MSEGTPPRLPQGEPPGRRGALTRRNFLGAAGGVVAGAAAVGATAGVIAGDPAAGASSTVVEPFYGARQGGIITPPQRHTYFASLDVTTERGPELAELLRSWTSVAANLAQGRPAAPLTRDAGLAEPDSGETVGLGASRLTVNFGFGPSLFGLNGPDRFGLAGQRPMFLVDLPAFPGDEIAAADAGGDVTVHACADDPQVAFHAVRQLVRAADGVAQVRWSQGGFNEEPASRGTPRNLMGFKDGTVNPASGTALDAFVWVGDEGPGWLTGGTYLVVRRIRIAVEHWDAATLGAQERAVGRHKVSGAPLGKSDEFDTLDLDARDDGGRPVIPLDAHVRLASPESNWGQMLLRRSYAYDNGVVTSSETWSPTGPPASFDAGLLFAAYQRDPRVAFIPIYRKLAENDALRHFTTHTASTLVALPPAAAHPGRWVGQELLEGLARGVGAPATATWPPDDPDSPAGYRRPHLL